MRCSEGKHTVLAAWSCACMQGLSDQLACASSDSEVVECLRRIWQQHSVPPGEPCDLPRPLQGQALTCLNR